MVRGAVVAPRTHLFGVGLGDRSGLRPERRLGDPTIRDCKLAANSEFVSDVSSGSATVGGKVDPVGVSTSYSFQYGTVECSVPPAARKSVAVPAAVRERQG